MPKLPLLAALLALSGAGAAQTSPSPLTPQRLPHSQGDAFLFPAVNCAPTCPLVIVSHSRGMSAETSLARPHLRRIFETFANAGYAVLVSHDAGTNTWGNDASVAYLAQVREQAVALVPFNGRTYTLGYSMGALPALRAARQNTFPVAGALLLDGTANLENAWRGSDAKRREEIARAHGVAQGDSLPPGADPLAANEDEGRELPLFVAGSLGDQTVPLRLNGLALYARADPAVRRLLLLTGPHLGGSHFGEAVVREMLKFLNANEARLR